MKAIVLICTVLSFMIIPTIGTAADRSMEEGLKLAKVKIGWLEAISQALNQLLDKARKERDLKKISCIEPHLVDIEKILQESKISVAKLEIAVANKDKDSYERESLNIEVYRLKGERIRRLVEECLVKIGAPEGYTEVIQELGEEGEKLEERGGAAPENWPEPIPPDYEVPQEVTPDQQES